MFQTPANPVLQGLMRGFSMGNMLRRAALEQEQVQLAERRQRQWEEEQARNNQIEDLNLAIMMEERGIRPLSIEDQVNKMTGTRQVTRPGELPTKSEAKGAGPVEFKGGSMPQIEEIPDDNKYVRFRGEEYVVPGITERTQRQIDQDRIKTGLAIEKQRVLSQMVTPVQQAQIAASTATKEYREAQKAKLEKPAAGDGLTAWQRYTVERQARLDADKEKNGGGLTPAQILAQQRFDRTEARLNRKDEREDRQGIEAAGQKRIDALQADEDKLHEQKRLIGQRATEGYYKGKKDEEVAARAKLSTLDLQIKSIQAQKKRIEEETKAKLGGGAPKATHRYNPATGKVEAVK